MSRKQVTPCGVDVVEAPSEEELHYSPSNVLGTDEEVLTLHLRRCQ